MHPMVEVSLPLKLPNDPRYPHPSVRGHADHKLRISLATDGQPGRRAALPSYFLAINSRCQRRIVSGVTSVPISPMRRRPKAFPLAASRLRWSSLNRRRFLPWSSLGSPVLFL